MILAKEKHKGIRVCREENEYDQFEEFQVIFWHTECM
jgi:hypothetical protein